jgi:hypothetical protein
MALITDCLACQYGDHDHHSEIIQAVPEGMLGGAMCGCNGECRDRPQPPVEYIDGGPLPRSLREFDTLIAEMETPASAPSGRPS